MIPTKRLLLTVRLAISIAVGLLLLSGCRTTPISPPIKSGQLDLSNWNFQKNGPVTLSGTWAFYWNRFLKPGDFPRAAALQTKVDMPLPMPWNDFKGRGGPFPNIGHATMRLVIATGKAPKGLALRIGEIRSAWRLWINGRLVPNNSRVGLSAASEKGQTRTAIIPISPAGTTIDLILQVSNYHYRDGGVLGRILLGREADIRTGQTRYLLLLAFLVGGLFAMGAYHIVISFGRKGDSDSLLIGVYCMLWAINTLVSNSSGWMLDRFLPHLSARDLLAADIISYALSIPVVVTFLFSFLRSNSLRWFVPLSQIVATGFSIFVLFSPMKRVSFAVPFFHLFSLLAILWYLVIVGQAIRQRRPGIKMIVFGSIFLVAAGINDIFYDMEWIHTFYMYNMGVFVFALFQSIALAQSFSRSFTETETLADDLKQALEEKARYEINPHFLFNSLASIRGALRRDTQVAREILTKLSAYCRMMISQGKDEHLTVREAMEKICLYLEIVTLRFGTYLSVTADVAPEAADLVIPPLVLQPLVENAIKYGHRTSPDKLSVMVHARRKGDRLVLCVSNSGRWFKDSDDKPVSTGTGLRNLRERLHSRYGDDVRISTSSIDGWVHAELDIPAEDLPKRAAETAREPGGRTGARSIARIL